ncbi:spatacsin isoform X2 [Pelobates cultripes]|nr:spatacsin isoform X2 [Pelobates cultripes]
METDSNKMDLCILLAPGLVLQEGTERPVKVSVSRHKNLTLCSLLPDGTLNLTTLPAGKQNCYHTQVDGSISQFLWGDSDGNEDTSEKSQNLLVLHENKDISVHKVKTAGEILEVTSVCHFDEDSLMHLCADNHVCVSSELSVRLLALHCDQILLLLNNCVLLQLSWAGEGLSPQLLSCFSLDLDPESADRISDVCLSSEVLFLLDTSGFVYVYDAVDGSHVAEIEIPLRREPNSFDPLINICVSPGLGIVLVSSGNGWVLPVRLNRDFRRNSEHHACLTDDNDEDELSSCDVRRPEHALRTDRSWEATLSSLCKESRYVEDFLLYPQALLPCSKSSQIPPSWTPVGEGWLHILQEEAEEPVSLHIWFVTSKSAVFCLLGRDGNLTIAHLNMETQAVTYHPLGKALYVDCAPDEACLVITGKGLSLVQFAASQDEFLSRLMIHGNASSADILCHLNNWGRCSVPIHTLEAGLENRQLDTVDFFLKSKENILNPLIPEDTGATIQSEQYLHLIHGLLPALDLLFSYIRHTSKETQSKHFSEQLLKFTLGFLNGQLRNVCTYVPEPDFAIEECICIFTGFITALRPFMRKSVQPSKSVVVAHDIVVNKTWENCSLQQIISDAILTNRIPEAQAFLRVQGQTSSSLEWLKQEGLKLVFRCLQENRVEEACQLLQNMGYSTWHELQRICMHTSDRNIRNLLVDLLQREGQISEKQQEQIQTLLRVEELFYDPDDSAGAGQSVVNVRQVWKNRTGAPESAVLEEVLTAEDNEPKTLRLHWAEGWDKDTQEAILLEKQNDGDLSTFQPHVVWRRQTLWHSWPSICSWIEETGLSAEAGGPSVSQWPRLTADIVDENTLCCGYMKQKILDKLLSMGIIVPSEMTDFDCLLERLAFGKKLMSAAESDNLQFFIDKMDFHTRFIEMCAMHGLQYLLYTYLDYHRLNPHNCPVLASPALHESLPWFGFLVQIRGIQDNPDDHSQIFHASLANAHMVMPGSQPSVSSMLLEGHTLLALATNMYAPGGIDRVVEQCEEPTASSRNVDPQLLKMALAPYPKLRAALFSQHPAHGSPSQVSLYHLLQALAPFSPTHFFTWQETNTLAAADAPKELSHFSCPRLVNKLSVAEQLDVYYYLRSGRPTVAFATFLMQQLIRSNEPQQLIQQMSEDVYRLALSWFNVPSVVASCVCFMELLGLRSHRLRVDVNVGNLLLINTNSKHDGSGQNFQAECIAQKLSNLLNNETEAAGEISLLLEEAMSSTLENEWEANPNLSNRPWSTLVQFCLLHSVPLSSRYLRNCAQRQDWLQLLVHTNSLQQICCVLENLSPALGTHIALALHGMASDSQAPHIFPAESSEPSTVDVFQVLLRCQKSERPGFLLLKESMRCSAPLLSVLAACAQDGTDLISCLCVWVLTSVGPTTCALITRSLSSPEDHIWSLQDLILIWNTLLERKMTRVLHRAFSIFMEDSPLLLLLDLYELCLQQKNYLDAKQKLQDFLAHLLALQSADASHSSLLPISWIQDRASEIVHLLLLQSRTPYEQRNILQLLCDCDSRQFCGRLEIHKLNDLTQILLDQPVCISKELLSDYSPGGLQRECQHLLDKLLGEKHFLIAQKVAELAGLPTDCLVKEEVLQDKLILQEIGQWACPQSRLQFWKKCHEMFFTNQLSPTVASNFFREAAIAAVEEEQTILLAEEELLHTLAGHWLSLDDSPPVAALEEIEQMIWKCRIEREVLSKAAEMRAHGIVSSFTSLAAQFSFAGLPLLNSPSLLEISSLPPLNVSSTLDSDHTRALSTLIDHLLDDSCIHEASRICRYYQIPHRNLWLVLNCRALATGETTKDQMHPDIQTILTEGLEMEEYAWKRRKRLQSLPSIETPPSPKQHDPVLKYLEILKDACTHGKTFCRQLLCVYELSQDLGCSFSDLSSRDASDILRSLISCHRDDLSERAHAVITSHRLSAATVANIVTEEGRRMWQELDKDIGQAEVHNLSETRKQFLQLAKLCPDPTLVGITLLDNLEMVPLTESQCIIELLIAAHECFTLTCHLEGIRRVLHACRYLIEMHLAPNKEYSLMVRLLSGIGRYNDMVYVFDILHKTQHFEVLLRKHLDTKGGLQTALVEYIKRCHPGDSEKHNMTALCFSMHRDIGRNHEHAALIQLKLIQSQPWEYWMTEVVELKSSLMKALTLLIDAAESYSKDSCVRQSLRCARLTRLLTLQIHLLNGGHQTRLINLERESLMVPILALPRFYQAVIVTEAYDQQPDWAEALYHKVIVGGDFQYFEEFKQRQVVQSGLFENISNKCKLHPPGATGVQNLKKLIDYCEDTYTRYKLAFENEFFDTTDILMKDSQTRCCLTDMLSR